MGRKKRGGFFSGNLKAEDELAREEEVAALLVPRRTKLADIPVTRLLPNPFQARQNFTGLEELALAIGELGFISRLRVRPAPSSLGNFQLVFGERRLRAAKLAGLTSLPCEVAEHTDDEMIEIGLAENIQRRDLEPLEEAVAFQQVIDQQGYSIRRLATRLGKNKSYIEDRLLLLRIPEDVQQMVRARSDTLRAAREISKLETEEERAPLIEAVLSGESTRNVQKRVKKALAHLESNVEHSCAGSSEVGKKEVSAPPDKGPVTDSPQKERCYSGAEQGKMAQDSQTIQRILARWREAWPNLNLEEQTTLLTVIDQFANELTKLSQTLGTN